MSDIQSLISNLLGRIFLKKPVFFGMDTYDITVVVGPSMKVYAIHATPKKLKDKFPFTGHLTTDIQFLSKLIYLKLPVDFPPPLATLWWRVTIVGKRA
jgi:hypothetical protein